MPFSISSDDSGGFWVENANTGRRMNKKPLTKKRAIAYQRALYANSGDTKMNKHDTAFSAMENDHLQNIHDHTVDLGADCGGVDEEMSKHLKHGPSSAAKGDKIQAIHDHANSLGADCAGEMMGKGKFKSFKDYYDAAMPVMAGQEMDNPPDDVRSAAYAIISLCGLLESEDEEPDDLKLIGDTIRQLCAFIEGELEEGESGEDPDDMKSAGAKIVERSYAKPKDKIDKAGPPSAGKSLDFTYAKSLGIVIPDKQLAVKFVGRDAIRSYTFLWGSPEKMDVEQEYFTKDTDFWDASQKNNRWLTWDHGQDPEFKGDTRIGEILDYGDDEIGRWYEAKLDRSHKYRKMIDKLIEEGVLGTSSDSAPQYVVRQKTGKATWLKQWPWFASALTDVPCEPRMIGSIEVLKSMGISLPDTLSEWEWEQEKLKINRSVVSF